MSRALVIVVAFLLLTGTALAAALADQDEPPVTCTRPGEAAQVTPGELVFEYLKTPGSFCISAITIEEER